MSEDLAELVKIANKIYGLIELLAEDKIAQRDAKQRAILRQIVGSSVKKQQAVFLMDGVNTQKQIHTKTGVNQGHLSTMVGKMNEANLTTGGTKAPKLAISIPSNFFENS